MSVPKSFLTPQTFRIVAIGGATTWGWCAASSSDEADSSNNGEKRTSFWNCSLAAHESTSQRLQQAISQRSFAATVTSSFFGLCLEPHRTAMESARASGDNDVSEATGETISPKTIVYDFVVIGHGNAGQSALKVLRERCPNASIALVDPLRPLTTTENRGQDDTATVTYYAETVTGFHPSHRTIQFLSDSNTQLHYRHGVLVATGARGAPPPLELFQAKFLPRLLELRTTELAGNTKRPVLSPDQVRTKVLEAAITGANIGILGSGWEALDLAGVVALQTKRQQRLPFARRAKPILVFGNPGPAWNILPPYLSTELRKKLRNEGIEIQDRAIVRYIGHVDLPAMQRQPAKQLLELHTAKTYDLLETQRKLLDWLVVAPDTTGSKGTAALPTTDVPDRMIDSSDDRPWYKTWSQLTKMTSLDPSTVVCYEDDGRIAVNTELCAASKIYAAGSVAKYPNSATGHATVAGEGTMDGVQAGLVAALNMSRDYLERLEGQFSKEMEEDGIHSFAAHSVPVWRSDITSYTSSNREPVPSTLATLGVQALCVGNCDSERQDTRGFWWTNSSAQRRLTLVMEQEAVSVDGPMRRLTRRRNTRRRRRLGLITPVYGIGIVYYLDKVGRLRGIMTWGLPFVNHRDGRINDALLNRMKHAIANNGGISALDSEENYHIMNAFLARESQQLVKLAVTGNSTEATGTSHGLDGSIEGFSKPLYRYTEARLSTRSNLHVLKRMDRGGQGVLGEDLYARDELALEEDKEDALHAEDIEMTNLPTPMYPVNVVPFNLGASSKGTAATAESLTQMNQFLAIQRGWEENDNRARPGKEDPLWLRPGDERRNTSQNQMLNDRYRSVLFPHRS